MIAKVLAETDLPKGSWSILLPCDRQAADILVTDDRFKLLSFTRSDQVEFWDMKARAGRKKVTLELGGNAAVLIDADTVIDEALIDRFDQCRLWACRASLYQCAADFSAC